MPIRTRSPTIRGPETPSGTCAARFQARTRAGGRVRYGRVTRTSTKAAMAACTPIATPPAARPLAAPVRTTAPPRDTLTVDADDGPVTVRPMVVQAPV